MSDHHVICPACQMPAVKWFDFGSAGDPHAFYRCESCRVSCAVQVGANGQPAYRSAWVHQATHEHTLRLVNLYIGENDSVDYRG